MRPVRLGNPAGTSIEAKLRWMETALREIERASNEADPSKAADAFTLDNVTPTRALDADTATVGDVADVLGTFLTDLKKRGAKNA